MKGWECPKCGTVWAPTVQRCDGCSPKADLKKLIDDLLPDQRSQPSMPLPRAPRWPDIAPGWEPNRIID